MQGMDGGTFRAISGRKNLEWSFSSFLYASTQDRNVPAAVCAGQIFFFFLQQPPGTDGCVGFTLKASDYGHCLDTGRGVTVAKPGGNMFQRCRHSTATAACSLLGYVSENTTYPSVRICKD